MRAFEESVDAVTVGALATAATAMLKAGAPENEAVQIINKRGGGHVLRVEWFPGVPVCDTCGVARGVVGTSDSHLMQGVDCALCEEEAEHSHHPFNAPLVGMDTTRG
ncbi:hypothetical protein LCGC14_1240870 [marine sediment metagenome]|uniref:Uncharacterized protein n=1 Tax=marine sediment metagenome TaxID=412755 RepID=A0A0F9PA11_9ZZZZ